MFIGPFAIPQTLARRPFMVAFWVLLAPTLFNYAIASLIAVINPTAASAMYTEGAYTLGALQVLVVAMLVAFMGMSLWSERVGAGVFAGPVRTSADWLAIAVLTGPIAMFIVNAVTVTAFAEQYPYYPYRSAEASATLGSAFTTPVMIAFAVILAPLVEEMAYRGMGMGCLMARGWSPVAATVLTSAIFTATHTQYALPALIPIFIIGLYFGALRVLSGSIIAPIVAHVATNGTMMLAYLMATSSP